MKTSSYLLSTFLLSCAMGLNAQVNMGNAFQLDGIDDRAVVLNIAGFLEPPAFTFECWVKRADLTSPGGKNRIMMAKDNNGWGVYYEAGNNIRLTRTGVSDISSSVAINDTLWHHVAVSHDGTTAKFYHDGVQTDSIPYAVTFNSMAGNYAIGDREGSNEFFRGLIDEVRLWNTVRSAAEIQANYCGEISPASSGLILYYRMNEVNGVAVVPDLSPGNHTASLYNPNLSANMTPSMIPCTPAGLTERKGAIAMEFYPNPLLASGGTLLVPEATWTLSLLSPSGQVLWESRQHGSRLHIDLPDLPSGMYVFKASSEKGQGVARLLIR